MLLSPLRGSEYVSAVSQGLRCAPPLSIFLRPLRGLMPCRDYVPVCTAASPAGTAAAMFCIATVLRAAAGSPEG